MKNNKKTHIVIKGAYGELNFGDDLLMLVFENYFLSWDKPLMLQFVGLKADYTQRLLANGTVYSNEIPTSDWLVYGGGTQFFAFDGAEKTTIDKLKAVVSNPGIIFSILKNKFTSKSNVGNEERHIGFLGIGLGPFSNNQVKIEQTKSILNKSDFVGVRDAVSFDYTKQWGLEACQGADVVFSSFFNWKLPEVYEKKNDRRIAIIVRDWNWTEEGKSYYEKIIDFTKKNTDISFTFVLFSEHFDREWKNKLKDNANVLIWNPKLDSVQTFIEKLNKFDGFISARYHGAILGVLLSKPVICIEIEPKLRILNEQVKELKLWQQPFDIAQLQVLLDELDLNVDYSDSVADLRSKADFMLAEFKKVFYEKS